MAIVLDSTIWIAYVTDEASASACARRVESAEPETYFTPSIVAYEVYRKMLKERGVKAAREVVGHIKARTTMIALTSDGALNAAETSVKEGLSMADAIIYSAARSLNATLVTGDGHFKGKKGVEYL
ncbi:hypothetical protein AUJ14_00455 [Candidatus Micrarchaeota archaeon CG1_02_55_22]|nr:MAG: hypothetical protein AUJ14_00455 [Candidatus Micrarchaeota archaeon CG1_02_55_22]